MSAEEFQSICLYHAESNAILAAIDDRGESRDLSGLRLFPSVIPDRDVGQRTMEQALALLNSRVERSYPSLDSIPDAVTGSRKKPWWKLW